MKAAISFRSKGFVVFVAVVLSACCYFLSEGAAKRMIAKSGLRVTPFTFQAQIYLYGENPTGVLHATLTVARQSDGTTVHVRSVGPVTKGLYTRTIQYTDGGKVDLADPIQAKTTWPPDSKQFTTWYRNHLFNPPSNCVYGGETLVKEHDIVLGHPVVVVGHDAVGGVHITDWRAPDLDCTSMQYRTEQKQADGTYKLMSWEKPITLQLSDPNPGLFEGGEDYNELEPSEATSRGRTLLGYANQGSDEAEETNVRMDELYQHDRAANPDWVIPVTP